MRSAVVAVQNLTAKPLLVTHAELEPFSMGDAYKRCCPVCRAGTLTMERDPSTGKLLRRDRCKLCGQRVVYTDSKVGKEEFHGA